MPLRVDILGPGHAHYHVQENQDGGLDGRVIPPILDQRKGEILALLTEQVRRYCTELSIPDVDNGHLFRAADELVGNGMRSGNEGDPRKNLSVHCLLEQESYGVQATLTVEDDGKGIPDNIWNRTEDDVSAAYASGEITEGSWGLIIIKKISRLRRLGHGNILQAVIELPTLSSSKEKTPAIQLEPSFAN